MFKTFIFTVIQPQTMLILCLNFKEPQPIYAYKLYACIKKRCM